MLELPSYHFLVLAVPRSTPWYASSTVPSITTIVFAFLTVLVTVWGSLYVARPRRALVYDARKHRDATADEVAEYVPEADPAKAIVVNFRLRGSGRLDVPSAAFDSGIPITVRFADATMHRLIGPCDSRPLERTVPSAQTHDGDLVIGPSLIGRDQNLTYHVLVTTHTLPSLWQPVPEVRGALIDIRLRKNTLRTKINTVATILVVVGAAAVFGYYFQTSHNLSIADFLTLVLASGPLSVLFKAVKDWIRLRGNSNHKSSDP